MNTTALDAEIASADADALHSQIPVTQDVSDLTLGQMRDYVLGLSPSKSRQRAMLYLEHQIEMRVLESFVQRFRS
jgi:hypothetical protein